MEMKNILVELDKKSRAERRRILRRLRKVAKLVNGLPSEAKIVKVEYRD